MRDRSILFINSSSLPIPAASGGAIQQVLGQIAAELANRGWDVGMMTMTTEQSIARQPSFAEKPLRWHAIDTPIQSGGLRGIWNARRTIRRLLHNVDPALYAHVVVFDPYIAPIVRQWSADAKIIWSAHNVKKKTKHALRWWCKPMDGIISVSAFLQASLEETIPRALKLTHEVIHNPLGQEWLEAGVQVTRQPNSILYCGRIVEEKGLHYLVDALAQLPEPLKQSVKLSIAGGSHFLGSADSPYIQSVIRQLEQSGVSYESLGFISHDQLIAVYDRHDVLVIPSNWDDPAPVVASEGQARNCRMIATTAGGLPEIVAPYWRDYLVPRGDAQALSSSIARMLESRQEAAAASEVRLWLNREFSTPEIIQQWEAMLLSR
ncbi:glycosyl transferase group 1 [Paenibacillus curdlanolyticus YK9]|uniref:Glycosyl transferase group 1 n=1 Tax=Paenibacillus curdlanolyticus YK9 TaxID=717606 RepID=E0IER1_9BACL|nr:glycosyltransferase family 4 protein [Paenibacillus curdlanolyticus]EFM09149.1 glycosyl transferase group 1 [Paenibacillus curdlanolyticus YK9]